MLDYFGLNADKLLRKRLWLFDLDGTIYNENTLFPGAVSLLKSIKDSGGRYVFITNNSSKSVDDYISKVNMLGIEASYDNFFTSAQATAIWLKDNYPKSKVYCQGTQSLISGLKMAGIDVTESVEKVDVVLVGFDTELTTNKIAKTCEILSTQTVKYIATNPDLACPAKFGFVPDCGSICQMIENATRRDPEFIGKPAATMVNIVCEKFNNELEDVVVVGDRLYTDIATGLNAGTSTVCVLTGEATSDEIKTSQFKPQYTFQSVGDIEELFNIKGKSEETLKSIISARSVKISNDISRLKNNCKLNDTTTLAQVIESLAVEYHIDTSHFDSLDEKAKEINRQLMWALRHL